MVYPIFKRTLLPLVRLFLKDIWGIENIPKNGPFIITSNHESYLDPFLIGSIIIPLKNKKIHFFAKKGRFWDLFGNAISRKWAGCVCADEGTERAFQELLSLLKQKEIAAVFIEGQRSLDGKLLKGKTGVVRLALKARVPILPIGLTGSFDIAPREKLMPKLKRAKLHIGRPIYLDNYYNKPITKKLLRKLTDDIMYIISELTGKHYN
ncbi:MAG: lysophospholipid acyltransferase family protein [Candidatus Woesearchaeota archaeon]